MNILLLFIFSLLAITVEARPTDLDTIPEDDAFVVELDPSEVGSEDDPLVEPTDEGRKVGVRRKKEKDEETCAIDVDNDPKTDMSTCPLNTEENEDVTAIKQLTCYDLMVAQDKKNKNNVAATKEERAVVNQCLKNWAKEKLRAKYEGFKGNGRWLADKVKLYARKFIGWLKKIPGAANDKILAYAVRKQGSEN